MMILITALYIFTGLLLVLLAGCFVCFYMTFYSKTRKKNPGFSLPPGPAYEPYREIMHNWADEVEKMPHEDVEILSYDGLTLRGKFYEFSPDADIELMFPGYRGSAKRDLCGGVQRCFALGRSALVVDQRGCGTSNGHIITFGVRESGDMLDWIQWHNQTAGALPMLLSGLQPLSFVAVNSIVHYGQTVCLKIV